MQIEFPDPEVNLPAVGDEKAGKADLGTGGGRINFGLYLSHALRGAVSVESGEGRLCVFATPVEAVSAESPTVLQLSAEREGVAPEFKTQPAEVPVEVAALVAALGGRVRTEVANVSPDRAVEAH